MPCLRGEPPRHVRRLGLVAQSVIFGSLREVLAQQPVGVVDGGFSIRPRCPAPAGTGGWGIPATTGLAGSSSGRWKRTKNGTLITTQPD